MSPLSRKPSWYKVWNSRPSHSRGLGDESQRTPRGTINGQAHLDLQNRPIRQRQPPSTGETVPSAYVRHLLHDEKPVQPGTSPPAARGRNESQMDRYTSASPPGGARRDSPAAIPHARQRRRTSWGAYGGRKASERGVSCRIL